MMKTEYKHIKFVILEKGNAVNPTRYQCINYSGEVLGTVEWMGEWAQYCFWCHDIILSKSCMLDIADFLGQINQETYHRRAKMDIERMIDDFGGEV